MTLLATDDARYPTGLRDLEDPPPIHVKGDLPTGPTVAIVGTRSCTRYGLDTARSMGRRVAEAGWVTVSGLARGIDAAAHAGTVDAGGRGMAVLGCGIDRIYPRENAALAAQLLDFGGAIVSEYPGMTPPERWRFPARNRLIAALASVVVVVESKITGGAQITAVLAAELGRPVLAVPGDIDRPASAGTNQLIRDGAIPVFGSEDLVAEVSLLTGADPTPAEGAGSVPPEGVDVEDLTDLWGCTVKEALARLGRLELAGEVTRSGSLVIPTSRQTR